MKALVSKLLSIVISGFFIITACQMGDSSRMSKSQQRQMQSTFESIQKSYKALLKAYEQDSTAMPGEMKTLYSQMQKMHQQMDQNHRHMMSGHKQKGMGMHQDDKQDMMGQQMRRQMQNRMTAEWYDQMQAMHQQIGLMHDQMNQPEIAKKHREMGEGYGKMRKMVPRGDQSAKKQVNEDADPTVLNGASLYSQNCASCHGPNAQGVGNAFPPLINSEWITTDKSVPIRIVRDGLRGKIEVNGETYRGTMPSFKARLSMAEIAAIVNYLRDISEDDYPQITQDDIIEIADSYGSRNNPWKGDELLRE